MKRGRYRSYAIQQSGRFWKDWMYLKDSESEDYFIAVNRNHPTHSHLQACGIINDHDEIYDCYKLINEKYPTVNKHRDNPDEYVTEACFPVE